MLLKCSPVFDINTKQSTAAAVSPNPDGGSAEGQPGRDTAHGLTELLTALLRLKRN